MTQDPYRHTARFYDRIFDRMNRGLRLAGIRLYRPRKGMQILDVGCGTGAHLEIYRRYDAALYGLDSSPAMLEVARQRLGEAAQLDLGQATALPYADGAFDLILCMLTLHEMAPPARREALAEMRRVLKEGGRMLLIDFHPGPYEWREAWRPKLTILLSELAAGWRHFRHYRHFLAHGGLFPLAAANRLVVEKHRTLVGGTLAVCLVR